MDNTAVFDKSDKGREEIITRKHGLTPRLRSLLVLVDGKKTVQQILQQMGGMGINLESIGQLHEAGLIELSTAVIPAARASDAAPTQGSAFTPVENGISPSPGQSQPLADAIAQLQAYQGPPRRIAVEQMLALQSFFNSTIKSTLGLRGFTLQLKVEGCATLEDFLQLRTTYHESMRKSKGDAVANELLAKLDPLLLAAAAQSA